MPFLKPHIVEGVTLGSKAGGEMAKPPNSPKGFIMVMSVSAFFLQYYSMIYRTKNGMTEIMPFPENNYETVLLDRPSGQVLFGAVYFLLLVEFSVF